MYLQEKESVYDLAWNDQVTYGQIYHQAEVEHSKYNFDHANVDMLLGFFNACETEGHALCAAGLPWPAYDFCLKCSHSFNLLDARGAISITERAKYIARVRALASAVARLYVEQREAMGFPLLPSQAV
jgi:glycyl-tRNA synthetase alpha chain